MNQKQLETKIRKTLQSVLPETQIMLAYQATDQGPAEGLYMHRLNNQARGWTTRTYLPEEGLVVLTQWHRTTYQFSAFVRNNPEDPHQLLADDILQLARICIQSLQTIHRLKLNNIGVERPSDIVSPTRIDDRGNYAFAPSFTATFTHLLQVEHEQQYARIIKGKTRGV